MKRVLRPAFVVTSVLAGCSPHHGPDSPRLERIQPEPTGNAATAGASSQDHQHPRDAQQRMIFRKSDATCYVEAAKAVPPPTDLMSGERWTERQPVACPNEFADPAFAALREGEYWLQDSATAVCSIGQSFGNPPPPATPAPCPSIWRPLR